MRKLFLPSLVLLLLACNNKTADTDKKVEKNENTEYLVSMDGIGAVKTDMSQEELEKVLNQKVPLTNPTDTISGSWSDSAVVKYKDAELRMGFVRRYTEQDTFYMRVTGMVTSSPHAKTATGIGMGSSKQQIIDAYTDQMLIMHGVYENDTSNVRSKDLYMIRVREDWEGPEMIFYLKNNKVYAILVGSYHDDSE